MIPIITKRQSVTTRNYFVTSILYSLFTFGKTVISGDTANIFINIAIANVSMGTQNALVKYTQFRLFDNVD